MSPPLKSRIWTYFKLDKRFPDHSECKICNKIYSRKGRTTTSLKNHLKSMHPKEYSIYESAKNEKLWEEKKYNTGREKYLIQQFTQEKIAIAEVQKESVEKELEEKTIKVLLLQEEIGHKKFLHVLEKEELHLKIELLKTNLVNALLRPGSESNMHIVPAEQSTSK